MMGNIAEQARGVAGVYYSSRVAGSRPQGTGGKGESARALLMGQMVTSCFYRVQLKRMSGGSRMWGEGAA